MVFNYDNKLLVELSLMYKCLEHFIVGTPIQNFFFAHFAPLRQDIGWLSKNPSFAARYARGCVVIFVCVCFEIQSEINYCKLIFGV